MFAGPVRSLQCADIGICAAVLFEPFGSGLGAVEYETGPSCCASDLCGPCGKDTKGRAQKQTEFVFAETEYPRRSQRYERSGAETNGVCFCRDGVSKTKSKIRKVGRRNEHVRPAGSLSGQEAGMMVKSIYFLKKRVRLFFNSQNYSIFALDFAALAEPIVMWFFERGGNKRIFDRRIWRFEKLFLSLQSKTVHADVAQPVRAADL